MASDHATALRGETGHTVNVAAWSDTGPALVHWKTGTHPLPIVIRVGSVLPLLDSAIGVVFYAHLPESVTEEVLRRQQGQTATRTLGRGETAALVDAVRREGYARTRNQMILGLAALAAPIFGPDGSVEAAIGLVLPSRLINATEAKRLGRVLREHTRNASRELVATQ